MLPWENFVKAQNSVQKEMSGWNYTYTSITSFSMDRCHPVMVIADL